MLAGRIENASRVLGAPPNWDHDRDGPCGSLAIRDEPFGGVHSMVSAWYPNEHEIAAIAAGAPIHLRVCTGIHPPVAMTVGAAREPIETK
jgi:hypothetical protein